MASGKLSFALAPCARKTTAFGRRTAFQAFPTARLNRHRGESYLSSPATPPGMRVRTGRFKKLRSRESGDAQPVRPSEIENLVQ